MSRGNQKRQMIESAVDAFKNQLDWTSHEILAWLKKNKTKQFTLTEVSQRLGIMARQGLLVQTEVRKHADRRYRVDDS